MIKFGLNKIFEYNSKLSVCRFFGKFEVWWYPGVWRRPSEWTFYHQQMACDCHIIDIAWFGFTILGHFCGRKYPVP